MQTYSHYIVTAALNRVWKKREQGGGPLMLAGYTLPPVKTAPLMLGSILPDIPLILLSFGAIGYDRMHGIEMSFDNDPAHSLTAWLFDYAFFNVWWVKALHNLFHAPLMVLAYLGIGYWLWRRGRAWGASLFWLAVACLIHTAIDIPLHYDDGPLLLFPINWTLRFYSPVSYWDPRRYGNIVAPLEHLLILGLLVYLALGWRRDRALRRQAAVT
ncbi:MAG: hypothetical protein R3A44_13675 [Caldilineaceae bacterium]